MRFLRHEVVLRSLALGMVFSAFAGCSSSSSVAPASSTGLVAAVASTDAKPGSATKASARARGPRSRPAQFLDPKYGK